MTHEEILKAISEGRKPEPGELVVRGIMDSCFQDPESILAELEYDCLNRNWYFYRYGTYVGVEHDGYIHS